MMVLDGGEKDEIAENMTIITIWRRGKRREAINRYDDSEWGGGVHEKDEIAENMMIIIIMCGRMNDTERDRRTD